MKLHEITNASELARIAAIVRAACSSSSHSLDVAEDIIRIAFARIEASQANQVKAPV